MNREFERDVRELGLGDHRGFLVELARPTVELAKVYFADREKLVESGYSRFGGSPDLPTHLKWPVHSRGPYRFIGQVNLAELPWGRSGAPGNGLLSFFCAHDEAGEWNGSDPDFVRAFYFSRDESLKRVEPPQSVRLGTAQLIKFNFCCDLPPWPDREEDEEDWPIDDGKRDAYWELRNRQHPAQRYLFGFSTYSTLAYDPCPGPNWRSLLTLNSDRDMEWCWGDGDWLMTYIENDALQAGDFSTIKGETG